MVAFELKKDEFFMPPTGAVITFHLLRWQEAGDSLCLKTGGNIIYHSNSRETGLHRHQFPEITVILRGELEHVVNGEIQQLTGGSLVFIRPSDEHFFRHAGKKQPCELVNFAFTLEYLQDLSEFVESDFFLRDFTGRVLPPVFRIGAQEGEKLALKLLEINSLQVLSPTIARSRIKAMISRLFCDYFMENVPIAVNPEIEVPEWFKRVCMEMRMPDKTRLGLPVLHKLAPCTPEHLCFCFRKYLNTTPTAFINELRTVRAAKLLIDSDDTIATIASEAGFQSVSRFHLLFKKYYQLAPARYRRLYRKNNIIP
jgi:AraC family cel operon transcriptional repressor